LKEEGNVHTVDPAVTGALVAICVGALMVHAGVSKRQLVWRTEKAKRERGRRR
jgi:hypothetical protein